MKSNFMYAIKKDNKDKKENETSIFCHPLVQKKDWSEFYKKGTLHDNFKRLLEDPDFPLLGSRKKKNNGQLEDKFTFLKVKEIFERSEMIGSGLKNLGLVKEICEWKNMNFKFMGMYAKNSINFFLTDIALCIYGITIIPLYDTLGEEATDYAFQQTKMETIFISVNHIRKMLVQKKEKDLFKSLKNLIVLDEENFDTELKKEFEGEVEIYTLSEIMKKGEENLHPWEKITPETIYAFSYTSGTTGTPKGAMISHNNLSAAIAGAQYNTTVKFTDVYLSYLPMAHVMERAVFQNCLYAKVQIGIYSGEVTKLFEDIKILKPTFFVSVPRIFNKIYDKIKKQFNELTGFKKWLINKAMSTKLHNLKNKKKFTHSLYDFLVFRKIRNILGGKIRLLCTGSAPIHIDVLNFFKIAFSCPFVEGYGQTEGCAFQFGTNELDLVNGHVGGPIPCIEYKLVDVPEMNYTSLDVNDKNENTPRGEILVKGVNIIPGYYKLDDKNKETFVDGWLKSGDIGMILPYKNALKIIDRKKNIFKLSQGEYIAPEKLENIYKTSSSFIGDIFVYGDSFKSCLVAAVFIDSKEIKIMAKDLKVKFDENENLAKNKEFIDKLMELFLKKNKEYNLNSLEKIKGLIIDTVPWMDNGLITNTMKKKRNNLKSFYLNDFDKLYEKLY